MVIDHRDPFAPPAKPDPSLVKAIAKAHRFNEKLLHGDRVLGKPGLHSVPQRRVDDRRVLTGIGLVPVDG